MTSKIIVVSQEIRVTVDARKFTPEFFDEFNATIQDFGTDIDKHLAHLAGLYARGAVDIFTALIEGYGSVEDMGITFQEVGFEAE